MTPPDSAPPPTAVGEAGQWQWKAENQTADKYSLLQRELVLSKQIEDLHRERDEYGIAGPIVMMAAGGGVVLGALYFYALVEFADAFTFCDGTSRSCRDNDHTQAQYILTAVGIGGAVVAVAGLVMLNNRIAPRKQLGREINAKKFELKSIEQRLHFSTMLGPNNLRGASLSLSF